MVDLASDSNIHQWVSAGYLSKPGPTVAQLDVSLALTACVKPLFCYAVLCVLSSFAIISLGEGERELAAFLYCLLDVMCLLLLFAYSSWWHGLVCSI